MDFGDVLNRAWKITWKHKILWGAGFVMMLTAFLIFPVMLFFVFELFASDDPSQWLENPVLWIGMGAGFLFYMALSYGIGSLIRPAVVAGVVKVERGAERLSAGELFRAGLPYYWRFLGLMALFALCLTLVSGIISGVQVVGSILTLGLASLCLTPLSFLLYPLMYAGLVWLEFAETAVVVDGRGVMDSIRRGWELLRANKMTVFVMALVVYVGIGMVLGMLILPFFIPLFFAPVFMVDHSLPREILWIAGIFSILFFPVIAFVQGIAFVFMKTSWILAYLRLTEKQTGNPISLETGRSG